MSLLCNDSVQGQNDAWNEILARGWECAEPDGVAEPGERGRDGWHRRCRQRFPPDRSVQWNVPAGVRTVCFFWSDGDQYSAILRRLVAHAVDEQQQLHIVILPHEQRGRRTEHDPHGERDDIALLVRDVRSRE